MSVSDRERFAAEVLKGVKLAAAKPIHVKDVSRTTGLAYLLAISKLYKNCATEVAQGDDDFYDLVNECVILVLRDVERKSALVVEEADSKGD